MAEILSKKLKNGMVLVGSLDGKVYAFALHSAGEAVVWGPQGANNG